MTAVSEVNEPCGSSGDTHAHETRPRYDDVNTSLVLVVGLVSTIITFLIIWFVQGLAYQWHNRFLQERSFDNVNQPVLEVIEAQKKLLEGDAQAGTISIDEAMEKVIAKYGGNGKDEPEAGADTEH